jgi:hypothetical protein
MKVDQKVCLQSISHRKILIEETGNLSECVTGVLFFDQVLLMVVVFVTIACDKFVQNICCSCVSHMMV